MDKDRADEEFCLDTLSGHNSYSESDSDGDSSDSSINIRKPRKLLPLQSIDSKSDNDDTAEVNIDTWSTNDKSIILEPFEGSPGIKILPKSEESVMDIVNLFIGDDFLEYLVKESTRYHYRVIDKHKNISRTKKWTDITLPEMTTFLGLIVLMGQVKKTHFTITGQLSQASKLRFFFLFFSESNEQKQIYADTAELALL